MVAIHRHAQRRPGQFDEQLKALLPHLGLIGFGGHTLLFIIDETRNIEVLASTRDDAAGEPSTRGQS